MFQKGKKTTADMQASTNRIVNGVVITGDIQAESDIRLDGILHGNLTVKGKVVIGSLAKVIGNITCDNADIEGEVKGIVEVKEMLFLKSSAIIEGSLIVGRLGVETGCQIHGDCKMLVDSKTAEKVEKKKS